MIYCKEKQYTLYQGKMQEVIDNELQENSIDVIITDPPYELNFMNKGWDNSGVAFQKDTWERCLKVLKPGGYLLAFGGTRTFHRIACAIEDAGFEIRDTIMWLYGSGFPKSHNVGFDIDKKNGVKSKVVGKRQDNELKSLQKFKEQDGRKPRTQFDDIGFIRQAQNKWAGYGTCLKPSYEPVIMARKPLIGTIADNIMKYGTGAINIDECRVESTNEELGRNNHKKPYGGITINESNTLPRNNVGSANPCRFPANTILTYNDNDFEEVCGGMPDTKSEYDVNGSHQKENCRENADILKYGYKERIDSSSYNDEGNASRYFYCAKASKKDRDEGLDEFETKRATDGCIRTNVETARMFGANSAIRKNIHPTVKPIELMQYLIKLVSPKGATILDPFMGSGSTGKACMFENRERNANYHFIGIEMTPDYLPICQARIDYALNKYEYDEIKEENENRKKGIMNLFDEEEN